MYGSMIEEKLGLRLPVRMVLSREFSTERLSYTAYGPTCDSLDVYPTPLELPADVREGDWIEFGRLRGANILWTEDWYASGWQWPFWCAKLAAGAQRGGARYGGYIVPRSYGDDDAIVQSILGLVGNGGKALQYFIFGPEYIFPSNCYSFKADKLLPRMARAHHMIGKAEDVLWPGRRPASEVAMLSPMSPQVWDRPGPFDATKTGVARTWKLLPGTHRVEQYGIEKIVEVGFDKKWSNHVLGVGNNAGWSTLPARVNGDLPSADMVNATVVGRHVGLVHIFAGTNFEVQKAGKVTFKLPTGLKTEAWINGEPIKRGTQFTTELKPGKHRIVIRLDAKALPKALRLESKDVAFLNN